MMPEMDPDSAYRYNVIDLLARSLQQAEDKMSYDAMEPVTLNNRNLGWAVTLYDCITDMRRICDEWNQAAGR